MLGCTRNTIRFEMERTLALLLMDVVHKADNHFMMRSLWVQNNQKQLQDLAFGIYANILDNQRLNLAQDMVIGNAVLSGNRGRYFSWDRDHLFRGSISRTAQNIVSNLTFARSNEEAAEEDQYQRTSELGPITLRLLRSRIC